MTAKEDTRYRQSENVDTSRVGDRAVLYDRQSKEAMVLNPTGTGIWRLLKEPCAESDIAQRLIREFPSLSHDEAVSDVNSYLSELLKRGVIIVDA